VKQVFSLRSGEQSCQPGRPLRLTCSEHSSKLLPRLPQQEQVESVFDLMLLTTLVSTSTVLVLTRQPWIIHQQARAFRKKALRLVGILLLVGLASCYLAQSTPPSRSRVPSRKVFLLSFSPDMSSHLAVQSSEQSSDWPTYHHDNARTGYLAHEPDPKRLLPAWTVPLDGAVYAEPLVIGERVIAATEGNSLYSLDIRTGRVQWRISIGHPIPLSTLNCRGTIDLLGITGTPVYDPVTGLVFAVAEVSGPKHLLVGVEVNTGKLRLQRPVDVPSMHPSWIYLQRPALALSHGMVYIAFGGLADDCGIYHGTIVASQTDGKGPLRSFQVPTQDSGGIWGPSGPAIDADGQVYVSTGNEDHISGGWDFSNAVLRLSPDLRLEDRFAPAQWREEDTGDQDLGSMGPSLLPGGLVFIVGKAGLGYLLHANDLDGIGGQVAVVRVCGLAQGGSATVGSQIFVPCFDGLRHVQDAPGMTLKVDWQAAHQITLPPIVGSHTLYSLDRGGTLYALDTETGLVRAQLSLGVAVPPFATPTISQGRIFVGTDQGVSAVTLTGETD
jgi:outer membrane protein assembly factor BamB